MRKIKTQIPGRNIFQGISVLTRIFPLLNLVSPVTRP